MAIRTLSPFQASTVKHDPRRMNIWEGSVRSSKTTCANLAWIKFVLDQIKLGDPDIPLLMVGKTERTLKRNVIGPMQAMLGKKRCRFIAGLGELRLFGHTIFVAGANDERSADRLQGLTLKGAYGDELSLLPESFFKMLMSRLSLEGSCLFGTSNPDSSNHWLLKNNLKKAAEHITSGSPTKPAKPEDALDLVRYSFRLADNPYLPAHYIEALAKEYTGLWKLRYIDGLWVIAEGAVYPMYGDHLIVPYKPGGGTIVVQIDYGTTNPFAATALEINNQGIQVFDEWGADEPLTDGELSTGLRQWMSEREINPDWICIDPSAASFKRQLFRDKVRNVVDADNDVSEGIRMVSSLMAAKLLTIDPRCERLQDEAPGYRWDPKASAKGIDKPIKADDHYIDTLRYGIATTETIWRRLI
jgi:PBSX family phage terminase large subunit